MKRKGFFIIQIAMMICATLSAQENEYTSYIRTTYNNQNGLAGGSANDIASTADGLLWIGTYAGLYRYNGHEFKLMNDLLPVKNVNTLFVDKDGTLFAGTNDNGLSAIKDQSVLFTLDETSSLPSDSVRSITQDSNGYYYVGTTSLLTVLSPDKTPVITRTVPQVVYARYLSADKNANVAAVTNKGELFLLSDGGKFVTKEKSGKTFLSIMFAEDGLLYAATEDNQIIVFDVSQNFKQTKTVTLQNLNHVNSLLQKNGRIFIGADNGAGYLDSDFNYHRIETGTFNNSIERIIFDYQGNMWISSSRLGLLKLCDTAFTEIYEASGLTKTVVNSTAVFNGKLYFATDTGLTMSDLDTHKAGEDFLTQMLKNVRVRCLYIDSKNNLWVCTSGAGILQVSQDQKVTVYENDGKKFRTAEELLDGTMAIGGDSGLTFIRDGQVLGTIGEEDGLSPSRVLSVSQADDGTIYCGTDGGGLAVISFYDKKVSQIIKKGQGLTSDVILRTVKDTDGDGFFLITSNSICYLYSDRSVRELSSFTYPNNYDLVIAQDGTIFILSSAGIFVTDRQGLLYENTTDCELLDLTKGLNGSLTANSWNFIDSENNIYLSCDNGAYVLNLTDYRQGERDFKLALNSVTANGKPVCVSEKIILPDATDTLELFSEVINFSSNRAPVSLYLEGIDEKPTIMQQNEISPLIYSHLMPGTYKFHLGILDSRENHIVSETVYTIVKPARLYETWTFRIIVAILCIFVIAAVSWLIASSLQDKKIKEQEKQLALVRRQIQMGNETIFTIANTVEARDTQTGHHSERVAEYSVLIGKELGFSPKQIEDLRKAALLHDIGKIAVPDYILNKPGKLTAEEYEIMKKHVDKGGDILKGFTLVDHIADGAKYHHERYDGSGYTTGLHGEEIPINARIIGLADAFDAMTAARIYKDTLTIEQVKQELISCRAKQFDPELTDILLRLLDEGKIDVKETQHRAEEKKSAL